MTCDARAEEQSMTVSHRSVPTAPGRLPLLGHALPLCRRPLDFIRSLSPVGGIVRVYLGTWPVYFLTDPALVHQMLVTERNSLRKGRFYERARAVGGDGLITSGGELHRRQRRLIQPIFQPSRIGGYAGIMSRHADDLAASWQAGQSVAMVEEMIGLTLGTAAETLFRSDLGAAALAEVRRSMPILVRSALVKAALPKSLDRLPIPVIRRFDTAARRLHQVVDEVVSRYRADGRDQADLLSMLLAARDPDSGDAMDDTLIRDEVITFLAAGTESTANTLAWLFHDLGAHPDVEGRLHAEVDGIVGAGPVGYDDVGRLEYTRRVVNEALRLHAFVLVMRSATEAVEIGGVRFPEGTEIVHSPYALHRDPRLFPRPTEFDPDRWSAGHARQHPRGAFVPFGNGDRKCIGDTFAMTEMIIAVATIAARWRLRPVPGHRVRAGAGAFPYPEGLRMTAVRRHAVADDPEPIRPGGRGVR
jgi:cytochrome P450